MNKIITIISLFVLFSCAPMPGILHETGDNYVPGITHLTALADIPELIIHDDLSIFESNAICTSMMFKERPLLTIISMGMIPACADVRPDDKGGVRRCEVWYPSTFKHLLKHELEHCKGYADILY